MRQWQAVLDTTFDVQTHVKDSVDPATRPATRRLERARIVLGVGERSPAGEAGIEVFVIRLDNADHARGLVEELRALHQREVIRVVDTLVINREPDDTITANARTQLSAGEAEQFRRLMRDAIGFQPDSEGFGAGLDWQGGSVLLGPTDARLIGQSLPPGQAALAVIFEHRWAHRLTRLVHEWGVTLLEDELLAPELFASSLGRTA